MNLIGHRGVAGLELENTETSLNRAVNMGLQAVEFDVRKTKDKKLVLCHDSDISRISKRTDRVADLTLEELKNIPLLDGSRMPTLEEALDIVEGIQVIIEVKDEGCGRELQRILRVRPLPLISVASFKLRELAVYQNLNIRNDLYGLERTKPYDIIHLAKTLRLDGIGLNFWLLNPLTYYLCKRAKLKLYVYTVNNVFIGRLLSVLYPDVLICTDYPHKFSEKLQ